MGRAQEDWQGRAPEAYLLDEHTAQRAQSISNLQLVAALAASVKTILLSLITCARAGS